MVAAATVLAVVGGALVGRSLTRRSCRPGPGLDPAACETIVDDYLARNEP
jgi:hypothetical protein